MRRRPDHILINTAMECYETSASFDEALSKLRRALSQRGFEIMRECDLGPRIRTHFTQTAHCRILYVTEPELLAIAISTHVSAALWLPIPVVLCERETSVTILRPVETIVQDRAALLGLRALVGRSYKALTAALESIAVPE